MCSEVKRDLDLLILLHSTRLSHRGCEVFFPYCAHAASVCRD